jgi:hypothetical protein
MPVSGVQRPTPPDGIRPGQLGVVEARRVIIIDVAVTLVDLSIRRLLRVEEPEPGAWLLRPAHATAPRHRRESLLRYETNLLDGLSRAGAPATLPSLAPRMRDVLDDTRAALVHNAIRRGWLHHLHRDQRTRAGDKLADRILYFRQDLRRLASQQSDDVLSGALLPYALRFALIRSDEPLARFTRDWVTAFSRLPGWHLPEPKHYDPKDDPVPTNAPPTRFGYGYPR